MKFLRANTDRMIKMTVPGAFTMAQQAQNDFYKDEVELAMDYATAVNEEIKDLFAAGRMWFKSTSPTCKHAQPRRSNMVYR